MRDGFSVKLKISNTVLEYDELSGLLSCSIPRQMRQDTSKLTMGIVSQQASISIYDFDIQIYKKININSNIGYVKASIYYNDKLLFVGFVSDSLYNENGVLDITVADPLILLIRNDIYSNPRIDNGYSLNTIKTELYSQIASAIGKYGINTSVIEVSDVYELPTATLVLPSSREAIDNVSVVPYGKLWDVANSFANFTLSCIYWANGFIYVRRVV